MAQLRDEGNSTMIDKEIEKQNLKAIKRLNQRGGRMLSMVDLLEDGTVDQKLINFLVRRLWVGDSILAAAGPSGTGKTTLMGALLNLIPPGRRIRPAERGDPVNSPDSSSLFMAHELNDAPYYGYIWGSDARKFLKAADNNQLAATLHSESLEGVRKKLRGRPVGLSPEEFNQLDIIATMVKRRRRGRVIRRVNCIYGFVKGKHRKIFEWDPDKDSFEDMRAGSYLKNREEEYKPLQLDEFMENILSEKPRGLNEVRALFLKTLD